MGVFLHRCGFNVFFTNKTEPTLVEIIIRDLILMMFSIILPVGFPNAVGIEYQKIGFSLLLWEEILLILYIYDKELVLDGYVLLWKDCYKIVNKG